MKIIRLWIMQIIGAVLFVAVWMTQKGPEEQAASAGYECETLRTGWSLHAGGEVYRYDVLPQYFLSEHGNEVVLSREVEEAGALGLFAFQQQIYVYLDGEEYMRFAPGEGSNSRTPGNGWQFVELGQKDIGRTLSIRIVQCYRKNHVVLPVMYYGSRAGITRICLEDKLPLLLLSILGIVVGALSLIWWMAGKDQLNRGLPWLAAFAVFIGIWSAVETNIYSFFFENLLFFSRLSYMCLKLAVPPFLLFVNITFHENRSRLLKALTLLSLAEFWATGFLQFFGVLDYADTVLVTHGILTAASVYIIATAGPKLLRSKGWERVTERRVTYIVHSIFIMIVAVTSMLDLYAYYFSNRTDVAFYSRFGYCGYVLAVTIASLVDFMQLVKMGKQAAVIRREASIDAMTKLYNRAEFEKTLNQMRARNSRDMGIIVFDLNNLKSFNDRYGHDMGDYYIIVSSEVIQDVFGKWGSIYRIGGDEFCGIVKDMNEEEFVAEQKKMEERIGALCIPHYELRMEIASGYAHFEPDSDKNLRDTMKRADMRMYERKTWLKNADFGKNR